VLITDRDRPGLRSGIDTVKLPAAFSRDEFKRGGCQAKLAIFQ
jgi:hypothetical protein